MFLGVTADVRVDSDVGYSLVLSQNPLADFVELPDERSDLKYSNVLAGCIKGCLESVGFEVEVEVVKDTVWGDECLEIKVEGKGRRRDELEGGFKDE